MRIYLAFPFTSYLRRESNGKPTLAPEVAAFLIRVEKTLTDAGYEVFLAHRREDFGAKLLPPHVCTPLDMLEMQRCDCVIALPASSYGVHVEIGWATAMDKPIVLLQVGNASQSSPLITGLNAINCCKVLTIEPTIFQDAEYQEKILEQLLEHVRSCSPQTTGVDACAFLSTSFGFGPVSKAVTIAREMKQRVPHIKLHYFGAGIDYDFAAKSKMFDRLYKIDVDEPGRLRELVPQLRYYSSVFSVLNLAILPLWQQKYPPLYLVDSLAWMWPELPSGLENVAAYFVQDYLLHFSNGDELRHQPLVTLVPPIESASRINHSEQRRIKQLVVNYSGCANPFADSELFEQYATCLTQSILDQALPKYERIIFSCNERLARFLKGRFGDTSRIEIQHFAPDDFIRLLASSEAVLSSPGITTTLEALKLNTSIRFLLPQNYSQALMSELYRDQLGDVSCMALSRFGSEFRISPSMPEAEGVARTIASLKVILAERQRDIDAFIGELLKAQSDDMFNTLRENISEQWSVPGQQIIVDYFLSGRNGRAANSQSHRRAGRKVPEV